MQILGIEKNGKRLLHFNFFRAFISDSFHKNWKETPVSVDDGGTDYWRMDYDPSTGKCLNFESNGEG